MPGMRKDSSSVQNVPSRNTASQAARRSSKASEMLPIPGRNPTALPPDSEETIKPIVASAAFNSAARDAPANVGNLPSSGSGSKRAPHAENDRPGAMSHQET